MTQAMRRDPRSLRRADLEEAHKQATNDQAAARYLGVPVAGYRHACDDYSMPTLDETEQALTFFRTSQKRRVHRPKPSPQPPMTQEEVARHLAGHPTLLSAAQASGVLYTRLRYWAIKHDLWKPSSTHGQRRKKKKAVAHG